MGIQVANRRMGEGVTAFWSSVYSVYSGKTNSLLPAGLSFNDTYRTSMLVCEQVHECYMQVHSVGILPCQSVALDSILGGESLATD